MIVSRPFSGAARGVGRNALDLPVAAFAAVAVAFLAFAMPADLLTELVGSSGLPSILSAAEPPLGYKARIGVGLGGAVVVFGVVFLLLRLLDRTGLDAKGREEAEPESPRTRRRDFHPDAPSPRPISAARDFGEPSPPVDPRPLWLEPAEPDAFAQEPQDFEYQPEPVPLDYQPEPEPFDWEREAAEIARPPEPEPVEFHPEPEPIAHQPEPEPFEFQPEPAGYAPEPQISDQAPPEPVDGSASIAELMARLERGLARTRTGQDMTPPAPASPVATPAQPAPASPPQVFPEANDDRLQSAIDSLQRLTSRQA